MQTDVRQEPQCSFCGKSQSDAAILIAAPPGSPPAFICEECVAVCNRLIEENQAKSASAMAPPKPAKKGAPKKDRQSKEQRSNEVLAAAASRVSITARGDPNYGEPLRITFTLKEPNISLVYIELLNESGELFALMKPPTPSQHPWNRILRDDGSTGVHKKELGMSDVWFFVRLCLSGSAKRTGNLSST